MAVAVTWSRWICADSELGFVKPSSMVVLRQASQGLTSPPEGPCSPAPQVLGSLNPDPPSHAHCPLLSLLAPQDLEIRNNAASYLPQISQLLNHVPRQMLLIFKTNDLLRGIEASLGTRASASSFLNMSRCCVRALTL